ncbi:5-oxoprolinase subunit PxpB [Sutcliffiella rhizosphaerae]|uniref:5-oxoprolinase subunit B n=1 Tax=Sutcliffiella rhizosphaerae TaxID=2880967 RepID=A0ABM8YJH9_9BACI|nr:5-oxoprolinase subunit PxpB [Sutcliffiella rhizosphaerae]CAG9619962.1 5-oxoprolinase subunit B [Sutcliffiella rhizosphaerae]
MKVNYSPLGDKGIQLLFDTKISKQTNRQIRVFSDYLKKNAIPGIEEMVPAYTTLTIFYLPEKISYQSLVDKLEKIKEAVQWEDIGKSYTVFEIPTLYGGEVGPDIAEVASYNGLTEEEVIKLHTSADYLIYMMGFVPGFPYLGGMDPKLTTPRRENPRSKIEAGSVGIAGEQTGVYPLETPGGWQIIGQTPIPLYNPEKEDPILLSAGNYLRFVPIDKKEFGEIKEAVEKGEYQVKKVVKEGEPDEIS